MPLKKTNLLVTLSVNIKRRNRFNPG